MHDLSPGHNIQTPQALRDSARENSTWNEPRAPHSRAHPEQMLSNQDAQKAPFHSCEQVGGMQCSVAKRPKRAPKITKKQRARILAKSEGACVYCGFDEGYLREAFEIDHFVPRSRDGSNAMGNLVAACKSCNREKGDMLIEEYRAYLTSLHDAPYWLFDYENAGYGPDIGIISEAELERVYAFCEQRGAVFNYDPAAS